MEKSSVFVKQLRIDKITFLLLAPFFCTAQDKTRDSLAEQSVKWTRSLVEAQAKAMVEGRTFKDKDTLVVNDSIVWVCQVIYPLASRTEFIGGYSKMQQRVQDNLVKPKYSKKGKVTVSLEINLSGRISSVNVVKGLTRECDSAALKACRSLVSFTAATDHLGNKTADAIFVDVYFN